MGAMFGQPVLFFVYFLKKLYDYDDLPKGNNHSSLRMSRGSCIGVPEEQALFLVFLPRTQKGHSSDPARGPNPAPFLALKSPQPLFGTWLFFV